MFKDKTIMPLFPTNIWAHDLAPEVYEPLNQRLVQRIEELLSPRPEIGPGETWQTRNDLQDDPAFAEFITLVRAAADGVIQFLEVEPLPYEVTGCWGNVNPHGSPHATHAHPNNYLSGVYYVRAPAGGDAITFHEPRPQPAIISPIIKRPNNHNAPQINYPVAEGKLILFPAWLRHSVPPNESGEERVSIAFNIMFSSFTETMSPPKWQGLASGRGDQPGGGA